jgi:hypothetical protein
MFSTSGDILNLVLSICITVLVFFLCWALYYFIVSVKDIYKIIKRVEIGVTKVEEVISLARNKIKNSGIYLTMLGEVAKRAMDFMSERRQERAEKRGTKSTGKK